MLALLITLGYIGIGYYVGIHLIAPKVLADMDGDYMIASMLAILTGLFWPLTLLGLGTAHLIKIQSGKE